MPIVDRLKKFIRGEEKKPPAKTVPSIVRAETDVSEYWTLQEVIGDGAFGSVYKAVSKLDPDRVAAAKAMELDDDEGTDVMVEVEILSKCRHPNVVQLYDAFTLGNRITLLLEFCGGGAIDSIMIELSRGLTEVQIQYVMKEILKALDFLHSKNVIHRDLKAGNVLLTTDAKVKLADFGVSAFCKDAREGRSTFIGTPYWMAPEVMLCETFPEKKYNQLADIWSFGITMIEMAEERPPYSDMNPAKVIFKVIKADPPVLERPNQWSASFKSAVSHCLTKDPQNRPSAMDLMSHPFFAKESDVSSVQRLICEVNAEQVTTEVVESEIDEDDDTSSSVDLRSGEDTHSELIELLGEEKGRSCSKNVKGIIIENGTLDKAQPSIPLTDNTSALLKQVVTRGEKKQRAPDAPVAPVPSPAEAVQKENTVNGTEEEKVSNSRGGSPNGQTTVIDLLNDLDDALELEDSFNPLTQEEPTIVAPSQVARTGGDESLFDNETDNLRRYSPTAPPSHNIKDIVERAKQSVPSSIPDEVLLSRASELMSSSLPLPFDRPVTAEVVQEAHFMRSESDEHTVHTISTAQKSVPGKLMLTVAVKTEGSQNRSANKQNSLVQTRPARPASTHLVDNIQTVTPLRKTVSQKDSLERKSVDLPVDMQREKPSLESCKDAARHTSNQSAEYAKRQTVIESTVFAFSGTEHEENSEGKPPLQPASALLSRSGSEDNTVVYLETSVSDNVQHFERASSASGSPMVKKKKQQMRAAFKVVPPTGREMTLVEVRRPASYPDSLASQARNNTRTPSVPTYALLPASAISSSDKKEKKEQAPPRKEQSSATVAVNHETAPTTSNAVLSSRVGSATANDYNYFGTVSSSTSNINSRPSSSNAAVPYEKDDANFSTAPPPEPPVDYDDERKAAARLAVVANNANANALNKRNVEQMGSRKSPHRQTVTKKTRIYMVDGVQMTSTSHQVFGVKQDFELRKQQLHDLRRLQREEARQQRELNAKAEALRNEQAKRFAIEKENVIKASEIELQALARNQKRQMREGEDYHNEDMKQSLKKIQSDQERELRGFREALKYEQKQMKMEIDAMPKAQRKELLRIRREQLEKEQIRRENEFIEQQQNNQRDLLMRVQLAHKLKILQLEKTFQQQKHAVLRSREAAEWDLEERQLAERHLLYKQELKDRFFLQRTQMLARHQRELEHMRKVNEMNEDEAVRSYAVYKKKLPKDFRTESKTRIAMFKESLRISCQGDDISVINEKMRAFEEKEKLRVRNAIDDHEAKAARKLKELREKNAAQIKELEEIHNEKRKMLLEAEQSKMEMYEKEYEQVIADWKANLPLRKQELEAQFAKELDELDAFYRKENAHLQSITSQPLGSQGVF